MGIVLHELRHIYQSAGLEARPVLDIPHWEVPDGAQVLLRGVSGSGKTTLLNILAGLLPPTAGQVQVLGEDLYRLGEARRDRFRTRHIGYIFQMMNLLPMLNASENVQLPMQFAGDLPPAERHQRALQLLAQVGLSEHARHRPVQLSTGQQMRVAIVRALANNPAIVLADEPTAALDAASGQVVMDLLQQTCQQRGAILIVASHDPALSERFTQTVYLEHGQLRLTPATLATHPPVVFPALLNNPS